MRNLAPFIKRQFGTEDYEVISEFPILHEGWEMDFVAWIVLVNGIKYVVGTNHGMCYLMSVNELNAHVDDYNKALRGTCAAIDALTEQ
jgi:hypothetical protein